MFLNVLLFLCLVLTATARSVKDDNSSDVEWPEEYTFKMEKLSLTNGREESSQVWATRKKSRVDYNNGTVKSIVNKPLYRGTMYFIHPETDEDENIDFVCTKTRGREIELASILPDISDFEVNDYELLRDKECTKLTSEESDEISDTRKTIWAFFNNDTQVWTPVRYEIIEFVTWTGALEKHEITDFYDFETEFDENIFDVTKEYCQESKLHTLDDDIVTKHLMFMDSENDRHVDHVFNNFKLKYSKKYNGNNEHGQRRSIFKRNMRLIISVNRQNLGYKLAVNKFSDMTPEEMTRYRGLLKRKPGEKGTIPFPYKENELQGEISSLPTEYDLRLFGVISPVKDQGECGSCWTFGTTSAVEGALARRNGGRLIRLSNQALIDCAWAFDADGCDGGSDTAAYHWMMQYGLPTELDYGTYADQDGICSIRNVSHTYSIRGFTDVTPYSVDALKVALVNHGPLSVSIDASPRSLASYSSGIFFDSECEPNNLNHEVTLVGYGERDGEDYWIIKNSWGDNWGIDGYMYISVRDNNCGVMSEPTYVVL